jgi:hypothetical protein
LAGPFRHTCFAQFLALAALDQGWALVIIIIRGLAIHALEAFVHVDFAAGLDGPDGAFAFADPALSAAGLTPLQPCEHVEPAQHRQRSAQGAQDPAVRTFHEQADA